MHVRQIRGREARKLAGARMIHRWEEILNGKRVIPIRMGNGVTQVIGLMEASSGKTGRLDSLQLMPFFDLGLDHIC